MGLLLPRRKFLLGAASLLCMPHIARAAAGFPRPPNVGLLVRPDYAFAAIGDSRIARMYLDPTSNVSMTSYHFLHQANMQLGQRLNFVYCGGIAGNRSDQYIAATSPDPNYSGQNNVNAFLSTGAKYFIIHGVVNDITQGFTASQAWLGYNGNAFGIKGLLDQIIAIGGRPILITDPGAVAFTSAQIVETLHYNELLLEYAEQHPQAILFDLAGLMWAPASGTIVFKTNYSTDGVHPLTLAEFNTGLNFAAQMQSLLPALAYLEDAQTQRAAVGPVDQLNNPEFTPTTGGTSGTGITGNTPSAWSSLCTGATTATISSGVGADGHGFVNFVCTFGAADEQVRLYQVTSNTPVLPGVLFQSSAQADIAAGSVNLAGVYLSDSISYNSGGSFMTGNDGFTTNATGGTGPTVAYQQTYKLRPIALPAAQTVTSKTWTLTIKASGAGSANVTFRRPRNWTRYS